MDILDAARSRDDNELVLTVCGNPVGHQGAACAWDLGPEAFPRLVVNVVKADGTPSGILDEQGNPLPLVKGKKGTRAFKYESDAVQEKRALRAMKQRLDQMRQDRDPTPAPQDHDRTVTRLVGKHLEDLVG